MVNKQQEASVMSVIVETIKVTMIDDIGTNYTQKWPDTFPEAEHFPILPNNANNASLQGPWPQLA